MLYMVEATLGQEMLWLDTDGPKLSEWEQWFEADRESAAVDWFRLAFRLMHGRLLQRHMGETAVLTLKDENGQPLRRAVLKPDPILGTW